MGKRVATTKFEVGGTLLTVGSGPTVTPETTQKELEAYFKTADGKRAKKRWLDGGQIREVAIGFEEDLEDDGVPELMNSPKTRATAKAKEKAKVKAGAKLTKVWNLKPEDIAEMSLEDLNAKVAEIAAVNKLDQPAAFEDAVEAIKFLTQDA